MGKSLCDAPPAGYQSISVGANTRNICSGEFVTLSLPPSLQNVVVYLGYTHQSLENLGSLTRTTALRFPLQNASTQDSLMTIVVTATQNAQPVIGCETIRVRPLRTPQVTYEGCSGRDIFLFLDDPSNLMLGRLRIEWADGASQEVDPSMEPVVKKSFAVSQANQIFTIGPAPGVLCGRTATVQVNLEGQDGYSTLKNLVTDPTDLKKVTLELTRGNQPAARGEYDLWVRPFDQPYPATPFQQIRPGKNTLQLPTDGLHCFVAYRNSYCPSNVSNEICQVLLDPVEVRSPTRNQISWQRPSLTQITGLPAPSQTSVQSQIAQVFRYDRLADVGNASLATRITNFAPNAQQLDDTDTDCRTPTCYQVVWRTEGIIQRTTRFEVLSYSNIQCLDPANLPKPPAPETWVSVLGDGQVQVLANPTVSWFAPIPTWEVKDRTDPLPPLGLPWVDTQNRPEQAPVCYQVRVVDACLSASVWSDPICTLHLQLAPNGELSWTSDSPFSSDPVRRYEVFAQENTIIQNQASFTSAVQSFFPDTDGFQDFIEFYIEASNSTGRRSLSNVVRLVLQPKVFFPTAFSPNGDGQNDTWFPKGRLGRITSYQLTLYDRTGRVLWSSQRTEEAWDGTYRQQPVPTGVYHFRVQYQTPLASEDRVGSVHLYR